MWITFINVNKWNEASKYKALHNYVDKIVDNCMKNCVKKISYPQIVHKLFITILGTYILNQHRSVEK